jgi:hypothetical protein
MCMSVNSFRDTAHTSAPTESFKSLYKGNFKPLYIQLQCKWIKLACQLEQPRHLRKAMTYDSLWSDVWHMTVYGQVYDMGMTVYGRMYDIWQSTFRCMTYDSLRSDVWHMTVYGQMYDIWKSTVRCMTYDSLWSGVWHMTVYGQMYDIWQSTVRCMTYDSLRSDVWQSTVRHFHACVDSVGGNWQHLWWSAIFKQ